MNAGWLKFLPKVLSDHLDGRHQLQAILGNSSWLFADKVLRMGIGVFVSVWVARYLGPERFGLLSYAWAFVALFGAIANLGLDGIAIRELVRKPERKNEILGSVFMLKLLGGCIAFFTVLIAIAYFDSTDTKTQLLVGIVAGGMIFQAFDTVDLWFQSQVKSKFTVIAKNVAFFVATAIKIFLILSKASVVAFACASIAEMALGALGLSVVFRLLGNNCGELRPNLNYMQALLAESWPLVFSGLAITLYMRIDQVMLEKMVGSHEVGIYSAALRLSEVWYVIPSVIVSSVMPSLTETHAISKKLYYDKLQKLFNLLVRLALVVIIPITFFSATIINLIYGPSFIGAGTVLAIHVWTAIFVFLGVAQSPHVMNEGLFKIALFQTMLGAVVNIGLNFFLIPAYGGNGAAVATLVAQMVSTYFVLFFFKSTKIVFLMQNKAIFNLRWIP